MADGEIKIYEVVDVPELGMVFGDFRLTLSPEDKDETQTSKLPEGYFAPSHCGVSNLHEM